MASRNYKALIYLEVSDITSDYDIQAGKLLDFKFLLGRDLYMF